MKTLIRVIFTGEARVISDNLIFFLNIDICCINDMNFSKCEFESIINLYLFHSRKNPKLI